MVPDWEYLPLLPSVQQLHCRLTHASHIPLGIAPVDREESVMYQLLNT